MGGSHKRRWMDVPNCTDAVSAVAWSEKMKWPARLTVAAGDRVPRRARQVRSRREAAELIDSHIKTERPASVYDALCCQHSVMPSVTAQTLLDSGANQVVSLLVESRNYLGGLLEMPRVPVPDTADAVGLAASAPSSPRGSP